MRFVAHQPATPATNDKSINTTKQTMHSSITFLALMLSPLVVFVLPLATNNVSRSLLPDVTRRRQGDSSLFAAAESPSSMQATNDGTNGAHIDSASDLTSTSSNDKNSRYVESLIDNLSTILDKYVISGSPASRESAYKVLGMIEEQSQDPEVIDRAVRMARRAGLPAEGKIQTNHKELGKTDHSQRKSEAATRKQWEAYRNSIEQNSSSGTGSRSPEDLKSFAKDKESLQKAMSSDTAEQQSATLDSPQQDKARSRVAEAIAAAGASLSFDGERLGVGGLDDVLAQLKRRVWTPLAVPPKLLAELGIQPVRGVLLYGRPGCGKTLLARKLGQILSPFRPITVVSGPEVMDRFVGSSEKNLRAVFDNPKDIYDKYRIGEPDGGEAFAANALHVIVMDEFDAIARARGGKDGSGSQGDAGVARDSVVNQLLAKMDGVEPPVVPTLVIALTNKRSLIDPALLRPGRLEIQIEVPPPRTMEQRMSILQIHTRHMHESGRLLVSDAPTGSMAAIMAADNTNSINIEDYNKFLESIAMESDGFSGASLAGVARAAASHALERSVEDFLQSQEQQAGSTQSTSLLENCVVRREDFTYAIKDILGSSGSDDWEES